MLCNEQELNTLFYWITERHNIYIRRQSGQSKPWTGDVVLQSYKFCNVFRELDTTTIWTKEWIRDVHAKHPYLWFAFCVARRINLPDTLNNIAGYLVDWAADDVFDILESRKIAKVQNYSSAYMLTTGGRSVPKNEDLCYNIIQPLWEKRKELTKQVNNTHTLQDMHNLFANGHVGYSDFLAYEIVTDMRHTRYLNNSPDIYTWANAGPGAMRGLNRIFERPIQKKLKPLQSNREMQYLLQEAELYLPESFPKLEMRDIEHSLCEFDKYQRVKTQKGFLRQRYNGKGE